MSDYIGDESSTLFINIQKCTNETDSDIVWKSESEINLVMGSQFANVVTASSYFDFDDYDTPIKPVLNNFDIFTFHYSFSQLYEIEIQQNQATLTDGYIAASSSETHKYYSAQKASVKPLNVLNYLNYLGQISVRMSRESDHYERIAYSFFDMFGYLGGLFDFWYFIGYLLVEYFNDNYFKHKLLSSLYQIESNTMISTTKLFDKKLDISVAPKISNMSKFLPVKSN